MNTTGNLCGMKILVVDDEPANVALLQYILTAAGYKRLHCVSDARQVMAAFRDFGPDLVLLDLMMPYVSGFEILERLRNSMPADEVLPILVLTADVNVESKHRALVAGASDYLTKPFDQVEVLLRIHHLLQLRTQHRQLTQHKDHLEDTVRERTGELRQTLTRLEETLYQLRSTQQQVIMHERLSALGSMAAGLAHDFNNSLSLILGYSELMLSELVGTPHQQRSDEFLGTVITAAQDAARMFGRLRSIYRPADHDQEWQTVDLNALVEQAAELTRPRWHGQALGQGATIRLRLDLAAGLPAIVADAAELREMLTNLIFNAVDAMPQGGELTLRTAPVAAAVRGAPPQQEEQEEVAAAGGGGDDGGVRQEEVLLAVADTGVGMDEETRRRCLEPFFTTKGQKGTGLGLAMVYGTMQRHGGRIALQSAPGLGSTFQLFLPIRSQLVADAPATDSTPEVQRPWRILVVDDQPVFVNILRHYLSHDLHTVDTAGDGHEALKKFAARKFDLVITDLAMPHMPGEQLAAAIKKRSPNTRIIVLTGYSGPGDAEATDTAVDALILKPVTHAALRAIINRTMAGYEPLPSKGRSVKPRRRTGRQKLKF